MYHNDIDHGIHRVWMPVAADGLLVLLRQGVPNQDGQGGMIQQDERVVQDVPFWMHGEGRGFLFRNSYRPPSVMVNITK